jgi:hypothetical protein
MDVSIHQPHYLPWIPYFRKIEQSDLFIFLDSVDFQKNGLQNRNQIRTEQGRQWLTVPIRQHFGQKINEVAIDTSTHWRGKHWEKLRHSYCKAASFNTYKNEFSKLLTQEWSELSRLNVYSTELMLNLLEIETPTLKSSQLKSTGRSSDLILNLCKEVGASRYISGSGGKQYLEPTTFENAGIEIIFLDSIAPDTYPQPFPQVEFLNDLSAIDILFNCGADWRSYLPGGGGVY